MIIGLRRVLKSGTVNFWRNGWISFATILVMVVMLFVIGTVILGNVVFTSVLASLEDKVDITVYFRVDAPEDDILAVRDSLTGLGEVEDVEYVSRDEALVRFRDRHRNNALITQSLEELGQNPLGASLNVQARNPSEYPAIANFLEANILSSILDKVNYRQNELVIERLTGILGTSRQLGVAVSLFLAFIAFIVAFNTIRMAIYTSREEIKIMKLVGASNWYTRGPFLVEGFLHGFFASLVTLLIFLPAAYFLGPKSETFFGGPDLYLYLTTHILQFYLVLFLIGISLGILSSAIAMRRYLRV